MSDARKTLWIYGATCLLEFAVYIACLWRFYETRDTSLLLLVIAVALFHLLFWGRQGPWIIYKTLYLKDDD